MGGSEDRSPTTECSVSDLNIVPPLLTLRQSIGLIFLCIACEGEGDRQKAELDTSYRSTYEIVDFSIKSINVDEILAKLYTELDL